jgi:Gram-negative bacterial TonB protein C-terminal
VIRLYKRVCLPIPLLACLAQAAFAQCSARTTLTEEERELEDRTVLLTLKLTKGGAVRDASVLRGPETLRAPAIKAAKARKYKQRNTWPDPREMTVEVKFPQDGNGAPEIRQALPAGVSSCVPSPTVVRISPEVMQSRLLKRIEPAFPAGAGQVEGTVVLRVRVDKSGNVFKADRVSGPDTLVPPAIEAVKSWKYEPFLLNGYVVEVETTVELKFSN